MGDKTQNAQEIDLKLVERVARAMCKCDGNDPNQRCLRDGMQLAHLRGIASAATAAPRDCITWPAWMLYAYVAETAIKELEAAAMEPFTLRPGTAAADPVEPPMERTPWYPPETVRKAWATRVIPSSVAIDERLMISWSKPCDPTSWGEEIQAQRKLSGKSASQIIVDDPFEEDGSSSVKRMAGKIADYEGKMNAHYAKLRQDMEKMAADVLNSPAVPESAPAPKDAVLIDALRRQREKEGW